MFCCVWPVCGVAVLNWRVNFSCPASLDARFCEQIFVSSVVSFDLVCVTVQIAQIKGIQGHSLSGPSPAF